MTQTLLDYLRTVYPDTPTSRLKKWISNGHFTVDGEVCRAPHAPINGERIERQGAPQREREGWIVHEDDDIVVVTKPSGLLSVATDKGQTPSLHSKLKRLFAPGRIYPVHRLDRYASGLLVFARTEAAKEGLKDQFADHTPKRLYRARVTGRLKGSGSWRSLLWEDGSFRVHASTFKGKEAVTHYSALSHTSSTTLLELQLETGRKHQIRVHCAEAGHPIVGDNVYGEKKGKGRLLLHAYSLSFRHPRTGKPLLFVSKLPDQLR